MYNFWAISDPNINISRRSKPLINHPRWCEIMWLLLPFQSTLCRLIVGFCQFGSGANMNGVKYSGVDSDVNFCQIPISEYLPGNTTDQIWGLFSAFHMFVSNFFPWHKCGGKKKTRKNVYENIIVERGSDSISRCHKNSLTHHRQIMTFCSKGGGSCNFQLDNGRVS